ncbi:MAG: conjugal transfer protein TraL [bacterium]|nr:conjugal transfer protein TraL [bacterium]
MRFPQYLSSPINVLWFDLDEFVFIILSIVGAMMIGGWTFLVAIIAPFFYIKFKHKYPNGFFKHLLYICGFKNLQGYPINFENKFNE